VDKGITQRQTAGYYLNELENIGILESKKSDRGITISKAATLKNLRINEFRKTFLLG